MTPPSPLPPWAGVVAAWAAAPGPAGLLTDFDGTLAAIVDAPDDAALVPGAAEVLAALADRLALVAVISGRPVEFLADRLGPLADRLVLAGLYGLERLERGRRRVSPGAERWAPVVAEVVDAARRESPPGVRIEDKGLTATLHARAVPEHLGWVERWTSGRAAATGLVVHAGKLSAELRPPVEVDKGTVVGELCGGLSAACYLGDDRGDLPAFAVLGEYRRAGRLASLTVAVDGLEAPPEVLAAADVVVEGPAGALALLEALARTRHA